MKDPVEPKHSCPDINKIIRSISSCEKSLHNAQRYNENDAIGGHLNDIECELIGIIDLMEQVRTVNDELRGYAQDWKDIATELRAENENLLSEVQS